jgi:hypothetical protein
MGKKDNRRSRKTRRLKAQRAKKAREKAKIVAGKAAKKTPTKSTRTR